ncbi:unnamed protein product [Merluccius merluccius]
MAEKTSPVERFLTCHVCMGVFQDPVSLGCHHSFCSSCLQHFWEQAKHHNCPICKRKSSKENPGVNFAIKELADSFGRNPSAGSPGSQAVGCEHAQDLAWFCKEERRAVCCVCESPDPGHTLVPIEKEVAELKEQLGPDLTSLREKLVQYQELEKTYGDMTQHRKTQLANTERLVRAEFDRLRCLLAEEEEARVAALAEEEERRTKAIAVEMKSIRTQICSLSESIAAVEGDLAQDDAALFLASYHKRARARCSPVSHPPQLLPGGLVDVAKHLGNLSFRVWEKMKARVKFTPVILDPNTASGWLLLSDDLTGVRDVVGDMMIHPDNPERFKLYSNVLGREGFSSGHHSWEVRVGDHPDWVIGVTKESADRKGPRNASPKNGVWCILHRGEKYTNGSGKRLPLKRVPQRIRIQLDYDQGEVSFYDPEDMAHICTHRDTFAEKVYPYFSVGPAGEAQSVGLNMCAV